MARDVGSAPVIKYKDDQFGADPRDAEEEGALLLERREACRRKDPLHGSVRARMAAADRQEPLGRSEADRRHSRGLRRGQAAGRTLQVKHRGLPVYTYAHERPEQVLCDNVDGWFVVRLR